MLAVQEARHIEIGADILDDDIGRVAPAADRDVAIGQSETLERGAIGAAHDLDAGARGEGQGGRVHGFGAGEVGANYRLDPVLPGLAAVGQARAQRRPLTFVDAERGGAFGLQPEQVLGDGIEQRLGFRLGRGAGLCADGPGAAGQRGQGACRSEQGEGLAAGKLEMGHAYAPEVRKEEG